MAFERWKRRLVKPPLIVPQTGVGSHLGDGGPRRRRYRITPGLAAGALALAGAFRGAFCSVYSTKDEPLLQRPDRPRLTLNIDVNCCEPLSRRLSTRKVLVMTTAIGRREGLPHHAQRGANLEAVEDAKLPRSLVGMQGASTPPLLDRNWAIRSMDPNLWMQARELEGADLRVVGRRIEAISPSSSSSLLSTCICVDHIFNPTKLHLN
ncbi:hypothetical protein G7046_g5758 [Stylonectria norvegica]|nr:hypothetical protein G7046_g5758 [Stylonectria norvegica]